MTMLQTGQHAPAFTLPDASGRPVALADETAQAERGGGIVYFYPKAATPGCTTEACDFRDTLDSLQAVGYRVLGVSPDAPETLRSFAEDQTLAFPLLSDADGAVAEAYGTRGEKTIEGTPRTITRRLDVRRRPRGLADPRGVRRRRPGARRRAARDAGRLTRSGRSGPG